MLFTYLRVLHVLGDVGIVVQPEHLRGGGGRQPRDEVPRVSQVEVVGHEVHTRGRKGKVRVQDGRCVDLREKRVERVRVRGRVRVRVRATVRSGGACLVGDEVERRMSEVLITLASDLRQGDSARVRVRAKVR